MKHDPHAEREARRYSNPVASREHILQTLTEFAGPASLRQLVGALSMVRAQEEGLSARLRAMVRDGQLYRHGRDAFALPADVALVEGPVHAHADGFGFVAQDGTQEDI